MFQGTSLLLDILLLIVIGYVIGMVHGAKLVELITGVNLKNVGTGNYGASNALLSLGKKYGFIVLVVDIGKGLLTISIFKWLLDGNLLTNSIEYIYLYILFASLFIGHNFPIYMSFKGGKGTAVLISTMIAINPLYGLSSLFLFLLISFVTNYLVVGLFSLYLINLVVGWYVTSNIYIVLILFIMFVIGILLHIENIQKIRNKEEPLFRSSFKKK